MSRLYLFAPWAVLSVTLLMNGCAGHRSDELSRLFKDNQAHLIQCQVDLTNASRDADLSRGQREVAEQKADQAAQSRLAVEKENQALRKNLSHLQELYKAGGRGASTPQPVEKGAVTRSLSEAELPVDGEIIVTSGAVFTI